jgi:hypothetical protein
MLRLFASIFFLLYASFLLCPATKRELMVLLLLLHQRFRASGYSYVGLLFSFLVLFLFLGLLLR